MFGCWMYIFLDIIEIISNCNTNSQGRIYTSILQDFSKTPAAEVYIEIHVLQTKEFACSRQVKTVEDIALQNKQKSRIATILSIHLFVGMAVYFIFFSVYYIFFFNETWKTKNICLDISVLYKKLCSWF